QPADTNSPYPILERPPGDPHHRHTHFSTGSVSRQLSNRPLSVIRPLKSGLDGQVTMDQVVEEVAVAHEVLGDDLVSVELGNEYDQVTTLTPVQYWEKLKGYHAAIQARLPHAGRPVREGLRHHVHGRGQAGHRPADHPHPLIRRLRVPDVDVRWGNGH
ncbi:MULTISPECIES: hypothetical protein, partial [Kribbella]|uniref:hypothetical protein n=1 Tax=Kribbella TaxID=182639 RepID=UPI001A7EA425